MTPFPTAKHLARVLAYPNLYSSILAMDSKEIAELRLALQSALNITSNVIHTRTHEESQLCPKPNGTFKPYWNRCTAWFRSH